MALTDSYATTATTTPQFYTDYLNNVATRGTAGANAAQFVGASPLQTQAFTNVGTNQGNYQPALTSAGQNFGAAAGTDISGATQPYLNNTAVSGLTQANPYLQSGTSSAADLVGDYMNPYTQNVVNQIGLANQQNIAQNLSPGITAGAVGSGQFGSQRGANALALGISNANIGALGLQSQALQTGYTNALQAAQQQRINQLTAGSTAGTLQNQYNQNQATAAQVAGNAASQQAQALNNAATGQINLGQQQQASGLADVNALSTLGQQQQTIAQNQQLFPLDVAARQMAAMSGAQIPTVTTQTATGSPLSAIAGLGALTTGLFQTPGNGGVSAASNLYNSLFGTPSKASSDSSGGSSGGTNPYTGGTNPGANPGTQTSSGPSMDTSGTITNNGDGTQTDQTGHVFDSSGNYLYTTTPNGTTYTGMGSPDYNPDASASTGSWVDSGDGSLVWQPN